MFDDPKKELQRLQDELLAEEDLEIGEFEEDLTEDYEDFFGGEYAEEYDEEPFYRNHGNGYGADIRNYANGYGDLRFQEEEEEDLDEGEVFYREDYQQAVKDQRRAKKETLREKRQQQKQTVRELEEARQSRKAAKKKKKKSVGLLTVVALAEILAIMVLITLWIQWLK